MLKADKWLKDEKYMTVEAKLKRHTILSAKKNQPKMEWSVSLGKRIQ